MRGKSTRSERSWNRFLVPERAGAPGLLRNGGRISSLAATGLALVLAVSCQSTPTLVPPRSSACRAIGRVRCEIGGRALDATTVAHFSPPSMLVLRFVDPLGRGLLEIRTDGEIVRIARLDEKVYWEGSGDVAGEMLSGARLPPNAWVDLLRGKGENRAGWTRRTVDQDPESCFARRVEIRGADAAGRPVRIDVEWNSVEPWNEPIRALGPPPIGYRRVAEISVGTAEESAK